MRKKFFGSYLVLSAQVAYAVGYESEEAFGRAFKREFGLPPARWRDQHGDGVLKS